MKKFSILITVAACLLLAGCNSNKGYDYPFQNPKLSVDKRVDNLISLLTLEEKVGLMMNGSISVDRLGIPAYNWWSEACHGICRPGATVFPQSIGLAATFDEPQQLEIYTAVSDEARATWNTTDHNIFGKTEATGGIWNQGLSFWCPNVNIFRDPRWGRGQETCGEDPYLAGVMGGATVRAMQAYDGKYFKTHACVKHYAVHSGPESERHRFDATVSMRDLWETYLPAFRTIVKDAHVQEVMCAYNRYEGDPCCGSDRLLTDILRKKWGYEDIILSDCGAINNFYTKGQHETHPDAITASADAVLSGTDLECGTSYRALLQSVEQGLISEAAIDEALARVLRGRFELGTFDPEEDMPWAGLGAKDISSPEHTALAYKAAREAMVLLKNDGILPLSKSIKKIAIVGPNADNASIHNGNYNGTPTAENTISILEAIRKEVPGAEIIYEKGCELADPYMTDDKIPALNGGKGFHADFFNNPNFQGNAVASGDFSAVNMRTYGDYRFADGVNANNFSTRLSGKFVADFTGELSYAVRTVGGYKMTVNGRTIDSAEEVPGMRVNRRATIPEKSFPVVAGRTYDIVIEYTKGAEGSASLAVDLCRRYPAQFAQVAAKAAQADVIIMVGGLSAQLEGEEMMVPYEGFSGGDRTRIELPPVQKGLLDALGATGKPVVFVNCTGSAIAFAEVETKYNALLQAWYAGQATGLAVADILFGDYNPAGRLPVTFYKSTSQLPDFHDYNMEGHTYRYFRGEPLYAFGYGLSYTTFEYGDATLSNASIKAGKSVDITVPVKNTGKLDGDEVVQIYVKSLDNPDAPIKSLKGFKRVNIAAGQQASVKITLEPSAFEYYDASIDELSVRPGSYKILYGSSSRDEDLKALDLKVL